MGQIKTIKGKVAHKHETEADWLLSSYVPEAGEIVTYDKDDTHSYPRVKVGDGTNFVRDLPFSETPLSASALQPEDLADWAKASKAPDEIDTRYTFEIADGKLRVTETKYIDNVAQTPVVNDYDFATPEELAKILKDYYTKEEVDKLIQAIDKQIKDLDESVTTVAPGTGISVTDNGEGNDHAYTVELNVDGAKTALGLADIATSGSYNDLSNKPTIPGALADLTDDAAHRTVSDTEKSTWNAKSDFSGSYTDLVNVPTEFNPSTHTHDYIPTSQKGAASGVAELDASGKVPSAQLPSYVDDVVEYSARASFPTTGETGKIYIDTTTNITYRWGGSTYVPIGSDLALGETSSTAYYGDKGKVAYDHSQITSGNPHGLKYDDLLTKPSIPTTASDVKAVSYETQTLTDTQKTQARSNIGAGTSSFSGSYNELTNKPTLADLTDDATHRTVTDAEKTAWNAKSDIDGIPIVTGDYDSNTNTYTVTDDRITGWNVGTKITFIPKARNTTANPFLVINNEGNQIYRSISTSPASSVSLPAYWFSQYKPITLTWTGNSWFADLAQPAATDLNGIVPVKSGGTGKSTVASGNFLVGNGTSAMVEMTPDEVKEAISVPTNVSELTNDAGYITADDVPERGSGVYVGTGEMPEDCNVQIDTEGEVIQLGDVYVGQGDMPEGFNLQIDATGDTFDIPSKISELENDANFITEETVNDELNNIKTSMNIPIITTSKGLKFVSNGDSTCYVSGLGTCTDTDVVIPYIAPNGDMVTRIGYQAFYNCSTLTSITIPNSVISISEYAFQNCSSLTSVTIGNSVTSIGQYAFSGCSSLISITLPFVGATKDGISNTHFGYIFGADSCGENENYVPSSLKTVVITEGTSIDNHAFDGCSSLTSIVIPDGVTMIPFAAFEGCYSLTSITIPDSVTRIESNAFCACRSLTSVTIPDSVTSIGGEAFYGCSSLTSIIIPNSVTSIGGWGTFRNCSSLTSITIPYGVTKIDTWTFMYCSSLTSINIPDSVTSIGGSAFQNCSSLTSIIIPNSVTSIDAYAFQGCSNLTIYCEATSQPSGWHTGWDNGRPVVWGAVIDIPSANTKINSLEERLAQLETKLAMMTTEPWTFTTENGDEVIKNVYVVAKYSEGLTYSLNADGATYSVTGIGDCTDTNVVIPSIYLGLPVTSISDNAFFTRDSLTSITIPDSVTSIGVSAFELCANLTSVNYDGTVAQWNAISKESGWDLNTGNYTVYCTDGNIAKS